MMEMYLRKDLVKDFFSETNIIQKKKRIFVL